MIGWLRSKKTLLAIVDDLVRGNLHLKERVGELEAEREDLGERLDAAVEAREKASALLSEHDRGGCVHVISHPVHPYTPRTLQQELHLERARADALEQRVELLQVANMAYDHH